MCAIDICLQYFSNDADCLKTEAAKRKLRLSHAVLLFWVSTSLVGPSGPHLGQALPLKSESAIGLSGRYVPHSMDRCPGRLAGRHASCSRADEGRQALGRCSLDAQQLRFGGQESLEAADVGTFERSDHR